MGPGAWPVPPLAFTHRPVLYAALELARRDNSALNGSNEAQERGRDERGAPVAPAHTRFSLWACQLWAGCIDCSQARRHQSLSFNSDSEADDNPEGATAHFRGGKAAAGAVPVAAARSSCSCSRPANSMLISRRSSEILLSTQLPLNPITPSPFDQPSSVLLMAVAAAAAGLPWSHIKSENMRPHSWTERPFHPASGTPSWRGQVACWHQLALAQSSPLAGRAIRTRRA